MNCSVCAQPILHRGPRALRCVDCATNRPKPAKYSNWGAAISHAWPAIVEVHGGACAVCGRIDAPLTVDHIVPRSKGGLNVPENVQPLCLSCNCSKREK